MCTQAAPCLCSLANHVAKYRPFLSHYLHPFLPHPTNTGTTLGNPQSLKVPTSIATISGLSDPASPHSNLKDAWSTILEEHLLKKKPTKQVYVGAGLPILPKRITEKMLNWEYINFNELLPFCDPGSDEEQGLAQASDQFMLFPGLGLLQHGHQVKYSFLQWASAYMAVMASNGHNIVHMCAYFSVILKASREFSGNMWAIYDANYRQKAEATRNKDWSAIDTTYFSQCFTGKARKVEGCSNCGSLKHETTECPRKKGKRPANEDIKAPPPKQQKPKPDVCFNWNYKRPCHLNPCPYKHECIKCSPEDHQFLDCPKSTQEGRGQEIN